jgi:pimeloyl-ACP methyl ester carboxylesterase
VSSRYLVPTAERLAPFHPVYLPDLPGFGKSDKPRGALNITELADALAAWARAVGPARAAYLGNSMGCQVIIDLAVRYPDLINAAVLVGPTVDPAARTVPREIGRGALDLLGEPLFYWPVLAWDYLIAGPVRTLRTLGYACQDPVVDKLPRVKVPTVVVRGQRDPIAPRRWVEEMATRLPDSRPVEIPGATHAANYSAPVELARLVRAFLQSQAPRERADYVPSAR